MLAMIIPGNGDAEMTDIWIPYVKRELEKMGFSVVAEKMPDPIVAHKDIWLPFIEKKTGAREDVILIGHSSGAEAAMRYAETHRVVGLVLVGACYTDLGMEIETMSGYYDSPWEWEKIRKNAQWIIQFASPQDPFIPLGEAHEVRDQLQSTYYELPNRGHFMENEFPELIKAITKKSKVLK